MERREKAILFGRGMVYERKKEALHRAYEVAVFLDNAVDAGQAPVVDKATGIPVVNPADIVNYPDMPIILLSYAVGEMYGQLASLGVDRGRIRFGPMIQPWNTFERMLFADGGRLAFEEGAVFYRHKELGLRVKTDPRDLERLTRALKGTRLYPHSAGLLSALPREPLDDTYGMNRGTPVDRYYIEQFLEAHKGLIRGRTMEIGDRFYTRKFGGERVTESVILHVERAAPMINQIQGDLATGEGLAGDSVDCLICTQTLPFIYDVQSAADHIVGLLRKGGVALITAAGLSQIIQYEKVHYGHFWSFTDMSLKRLFADRKSVV